MARDFRAEGLLTSRIIGSGSGPGLVIYDDSIASNNLGGVSVSSNLLTNVGNDVFLLVHGTPGSKDSNNRGTALFKGDLVVSGTLYTESHIVEVNRTNPGNFTVYTSDGQGSSEVSLFSEGDYKLVSIHDAPDTGVGALQTDTNFYVSGSIGERGVADSRGTAVFGGDLVVSGSIFGLGDFSHSGGLDLNQGDLTLSNGDLELTGSFRHLGNYVLNGNISQTGNQTLSGNVGLTGDLTQTGDYNLTGGLTQTGNIGLTGNLTQAGNINLTGDLTQTGDYNLTGSLTQAGDYNLTGGLTQTGNIDLTGNITQAGNIGLTGNLTQTGDFTLDGSLLPSGDDDTIGASDNSWDNIYAEKITSEAPNLLDLNFDTPSDHNDNVLLQSVESVYIKIDSDNGATDNQFGIYRNNEDLIDTNALYLVKEDGTSTTKGQANFLAGSHTTGTVLVSGSIVVSGTVTDADGNQIGGSTIGDADDGDYTDGLFTDFTSETPIGTAIDRFNEVLKSLAPRPAPDMDQFTVSTSNGITANLSFGASEVLADYASVSNTAGYDAIDVNGSYEPLSNVAGSYRLGIYNGTQDISGVLNNDVNADQYQNTQINYPSDSFGNADQGSLKLFLNGVEIHSITFDADDPNTFVGAGDPGAGTASSLNADGSGFTNMSIADSGKFSNGDDFVSFKHRTGNWIVDSASQRNGWNYAQVKHVIGQTEHVTGYAEWVNDDNSDGITITNSSFNVNMAGELYLSGVKYNTSGTAAYIGTVNNAYKNIYDSNPITFTTTTSSGTYELDSVNKPIIDTNTEDSSKTISLSQSGVINTTKMIGGTITANATVTHPFAAKGISNGGALTLSNDILLYNVADTATNTSETFQREAYRLTDYSYDSQADVSDAFNQWDSQNNITQGISHGTGLMVFDEKLVSPTNSFNSGDFRNTDDSGTIAHGPASNPDYSSATGERVYIRKFQNTTGTDVRDLGYTLNGDGTLVANGESLNGDEFKLFFKFPSNGSDNTGWLDAATAFTYHSTNDNDGCSIGTLDTDLNSTNYITFGTGSLLNNEYVVAKIVADTSWTGEISSFQVAFGMVTNVSEPSDVNELDSEQSGVSGKLSFGSSLAKANYTNIGSIQGGYNAVDVNSTFNVSGHRRGIFDKTTTISGPVNDSVTASGNNYVNDSFSDGNKGSLKLEVNGTVVHTVDLTSFGTGSSLNVNSSGFVNVTDAIVGKNNFLLPDYRKFYRTADFSVNPADQRNGWNYARVIHTVDSVDRETNYIEWVNDDSGLDITFSNLSVSNVSAGASGTNYLSGVEYYKSPIGEFSFTASNVYKYVYSDSASAISFPTTTQSTITSIEYSGDGITDGSSNGSSTSLPTLLTSVADSYDDDLNIVGNFTFDQVSSLPGVNASAATLTGRIAHPLSGNFTTNSVSSSNVLIQTFSTSTQSDTLEEFTNETQRLPDNVLFSDQSSVTSNNWDSTAELNNGLMVYNEQLIYPEGNFKNNGESGASGNLHSPAGNPDYTSSTGTKYFYRRFKNTTSSSQTGFTLTIGGNGSTLIDPDGTLSATNIKVSVKIPLTSSSQSTGYLNIAKDFETGQYNDDDGSLNGTLDSSISSGDSAVNTITFGQKFVLANEYIILKIEADQNWTGYIDSINVNWG